jgi:2-polyprenyl-3-methyl-5-hydroxy-6-metoxy-1,4-benzoquinol methylase
MTLAARLLAYLPFVGPKVDRLIREIMALRAGLDSLREVSTSLGEREAATREEIMALRAGLDGLREVSTSLRERAAATQEEIMALRAGLDGLRETREEMSHLAAQVEVLTSQVSKLRQTSLTAYRANLEKSPKAALISDRELQRHIAALRQNLALDTPAIIKDTLKSPMAIQALAYSWWQRLAIPGTDCFTTSDHDRLTISDPGYLNTLGGLLTPEEGCILRPMPKWSYLERIIPDLAQKTVLEIGCNNGYFCFEFAKLGAAQVTGAEVHGEFLKPAQWMATARGTRNIEFLLTDALLDLRLPAHDVVFMSEVYTHFIDPFFGILRAINLAKETLIIDNATLTTSDYEMDIGFELDQATGKPVYHAWALSDGLVLVYLMLCGIPPDRVTRYFAPWQNHIVYVIDTRHVASYRKANDFQTCNTSFINMQWRT